MSSYDERQADLDRRLARAQRRNAATAACNARLDCTSENHLPVCPMREQPHATKEHTHGS